MSGHKELNILGPSSVYHTLDTGLFTYFSNFVHLSASKQQQTE